MDGMTGLFDYFINGYHETTSSIDKVYCLRMANMVSLFHLDNHC